MSQQLRMVLAVGLSLLVFYGWYTWVAPPPKKPVASTLAPVASPQGTAHNVTTNEEPVSVVEPTPTVADPQSEVPEKITSITTDLLSIELSTIGGGPRTWQLLKYRVGNGETQSVDLAAASETAALQLSGDLLQGRLPPSAHFTREHHDAQRVSYRWHGNGVEVTKTYRFQPGSYLVDLEIAIRNLGQTPLQGHVQAAWTLQNTAQPQSGFLSFLRGPPNVWGGIYYKDGKVMRIGPQTGAHAENAAGRIYWGGVENRYYLAALLPRSQSADGQAEVASQPLAQAGTNQIRTAVAGSPVTISPGQTVTESFSLYGGPKQLEMLKAAGMHLDQAIDYGWFGFAALPLLYLLKFFYTVVHNYGVAIILLTLFIKLLLHPINKRSMQSMKKMQALQPRIKELREKYKSDAQRLNAETMQLFRSYGVNPMGGCLPMVLQIPVYIALYKVLWNAIELYRAPFFWFYRDLSAPDPYFITPVLLGVAFFLQQKLTPSPTADPAQQKIMMFMPLMFTAFMVFLPVGLVIYIFVNTAFTVLQQWLTNRGLGFRDLFRGRLAPRMG